MNGDYDYVMKLIMIGNLNVGKSSLILRYADDIFYDKIWPTIGVDF